MSNNKDNFNVSDLGSGIQILPLFLCRCSIARSFSRIDFEGFLVFDFEALNEEDRAGLVNALKVRQLILLFFFYRLIVVGCH